MSAPQQSRWYRRLLALFPAEFRADFGDSMQADFVDEARAARSHGRAALAVLWLRTIGGFLRVGPREHLSRVSADARYGLRLAWRRPGPTVAVALVLALGIASLTATFTIVDAFLWRPLPFASPERLVHVWTIEQSAPAASLRSSWPDIQVWANARTLEDIAAFNYTEEDLLAADRPERLSGARVSANVFSVLGTPPAHGRLFHDGEDQPGAAPVAIVSASFADQRFGNGSSALGRRIQIGDLMHEIVGVMPARFVFPLPTTEVWLPYVLDARYTREHQSLQAVARLAPGATLESASAELTALAAAQSEVHGDRIPRGVRLEPIRNALNFADEFFRIGGPVLMFASLLILFVACANVSSVLLGQALMRAGEAAVRAAIGASRLRLARQFAFEQTALLVLSLALGLAVAQAILAAAALAIPPDLYRMGELAIDRRAALFALVAASTAVLVAALVPALRLGRVDLSSVMQSGGRAYSFTPRALRLQHALIGTQICASVALVAATFTALQALGSLAAREPGFDRQQVLTLKFLLNAPRYPTPAAVADFHHQVIERVGASSGVVAAATVNHLPLNHETARIAYHRLGETAAADATKPSAIEVIVSSGYFGAMGIQHHEGRVFDTRDSAGAPPAAIVNRALADRVSPDSTAVGRRLAIGDSGAIVEIVGVVANTRHHELAGPDEPILYRPAAQAPRRHARVVVRTAGDPRAVTGIVQQAVWSVDPALPLTEIRTLEDVVREFLLPQRALSVSIAALGAAALLVAATGLYGLLALLVAGRRQEVGIRLALGAGTLGIIAAIAGRVLATVAIGTAAGLGLSAALATGVAALLPGASAADPVALFATPLLLLAVAGLAAIVPIRRATHVDPVSVLREIRS